MISLTESAIHDEPVNNEAHITLPRLKVVPDKPDKVTGLYTHEVNRHDNLVLQHSLRTLNASSGYVTTPRSVCIDTLL